MTRRESERLRLLELGIMRFLLKTGPANRTETTITPAFLSGIDRGVIKTTKEAR